MTNACMPRSRTELLATVARINPEHALQYQRRDVTGDGLPETFCNTFAADLCREMGVELPRALANQQLEWLDSELGRRAGWDVCSRVEAAVSAELGKVVIAGAVNTGGHGHIAIVVPSIGGGVYVAQAGVSNFNSKPLERGFGNLPVHFWSHP